MTIDFGMFLKLGILKNPIRKLLNANTFFFPQTLKANWISPLDLVYLCIHKMLSSWISVIHNLMCSLHDVNEVTYSICGQDANPPPVLRDLIFFLANSSTSARLAFPTAPSLREEELYRKSSSGYVPNAQGISPRSTS